MVDVNNYTLTVHKEDSNYGKYSIGPFPKGFGDTFGNALRRILLSSIEGAAVTSIKVSGVKHEYTTLPGVYDDILTIMLRLKELSLKCFSDEPQIITLSVKGKKKVTASDIELTSEVELANPELHITELTTPNAKLDIEITVTKGTGYKLGDESKRSEVGVIPLDSNFSPVKRVNLTISATRVGQETNFDQIDLEIFTNGAVSARESLNQSVEIYSAITKRLLDIIRGEVKEEVKVSEKVEEDKQVSESSDLDIEKLNLSVRLTNSLLKAGYKNLVELEGMTNDQITEIRGLGKKSVEELIETMNSYKLKIGE